MKKLAVIGVPFALGGEELGPARGPDAFIQHGLLAHLRTMRDLDHYVDVKRISSCGDEVFALTPDKQGRVHSEFRVQRMRTLAGTWVSAAHQLGHIPVILGGDHSVSLGTLSEYLNPTLSLGRRVGLLWIDAHYDAHTHLTSSSHHANGMPLATALGHGKRSLGRYHDISRKTREGELAMKRERLCFDPSCVIHIGAGEDDCEPEEILLLDKLGVKRVTMKDIHEGSARVFLDPLATLLENIDDLIVTFDLDAIHRAFAPGVSFQSNNGMFPHQAYAIARLIQESGKLRQLEIMEYNPDFETSWNGGPVTIAFVKHFCTQLFGA